MHDSHHIFHPRADYRTPTEKRFRRLPCNVVQIDKITHRLLHQYTKPPQKPPVDVMVQAIRRHEQGDCSCG